MCRSLMRRLFIFVSLQTPFAILIFNFAISFLMKKKGNGNAFRKSKLHLFCVEYSNISTQEPRSYEYCLCNNQNIVVNNQTEMMKKATQIRRSIWYFDENLHFGCHFVLLRKSRVSNLHAD